MLKLTIQLATLTIFNHPWRASRLCLFQHHAGPPSPAPSAWWDLDDAKPWNGAERCPPAASPGVNWPWIAGSPYSVGKLSWKPAISMVHFPLPGWPECNPRESDDSFEWHLFHQNIPIVIIEWDKILHTVMDSTVIIILRIKIGTPRMTPAGLVSSTSSWPSSCTKLSEKSEELLLDQRYSGIHFLAQCSITPCRCCLYLSNCCWWLTVTDHRKHQSTHQRYIVEARRRDQNILLWRDRR